MRVAEQCEDCAHSVYEEGSDVGACLVKGAEWCTVLNANNDCQEFDHAQIRTRCVDGGCDDATDG